jgi:hypothetical protein
MLHNAYYDGFNFRAVRPGKVGQFRVAGGAYPTVSLSYGADAPAADAAVTFPSNAFAAQQVPAGNAGNIFVVKVGAQTMGWATTAPTGGTWQQGDVIYKADAAVGAPNGWRCVQSGSPGAWVPMSNL